MSQLPTIISEPESADADTQDGKDGGEKEAETYDVFEVSCRLINPVKKCSTTFHHGYT